jgi:hypothetical protein
VALMDFTGYKIVSAKILKTWLRAFSWDFEDGKEFAKCSSAEGTKLRHDWYTHPLEGKRHLKQAPGLVKGCEGPRVLYKKWKSKVTRVWYSRYEQNGIRELLK